MVQHFEVSKELPWKIWKQSPLITTTIPLTLAKLREYMASLLSHRCRSAKWNPPFDSCHGAADFSSLMNHPMRIHRRVCTVPGYQKKTQRFGHYKEVRIYSSKRPLIALTISDNKWNAEKEVYANGWKSKRYHGLWPQINACHTALSILAVDPGLCSLGELVCSTPPHAHVFQLIYPELEESKHTTEDQDRRTPMKMLIYRSHRKKTPQSEMWLHCLSPITMASQ